MHHEARQWVARFRTDMALRVLDLGGRDVNGSCRSLFPNADYTVLDLRPGPDVDIVANAATWNPDRAYDLVLCTEVFEHTPDWPAICATAYRALRPKGEFIVTCAAPGRKPHSGIDDTKITSGEWYENIEPERLIQVLRNCGFHLVMIDAPRIYDVRAHAIR